MECAKIDKEAKANIAKQYQKEQLIYTVTSSVIPLIVVFVLGLFALIILKNFITKMPAPRMIEKKVIEDTSRAAEEEEIEAALPKIELNKKEIQSQKEQTITELNEAIMGAPEEAAKLITSFIRE